MENKSSVTLKKIALSGCIFICAKNKDNFKSTILNNISRLSVQNEQHEKYDDRFWT